MQICLNSSRHCTLEVEATLLYVERRFEQGEEQPLQRHVPLIAPQSPKLAVHNREHVALEL